MDPSIKSRVQAIPWLQTGKEEEIRVRTKANELELERAKLNGGGRKGSSDVYRPSHPQQPVPRQMDRLT